MKQPDQIKKVLELIQKHPKLPIVPMVWGELVSGDEYRRWMGSWGDAYITKYIIGDNGIYFYDEDDRSECLEDPGVCLYLPEEDFETDEEELKAYKKLPWTEAIIVNIDMPDEG